MPPIEVNKVDSCFSENLEVIHWRDVEEMNPQSRNMWKIKLTPEMLEEEGYKHKFFDRSKSRYIYIVCDKYYTYEWFRRTIMIPLGFVVSEGKSSEQVRKEYMQFMKEVYDYAQSKRWGQIFPSVSERDVDKFLVEELYSSESFRKWFLDKTVGFNFDIKNFKNVSSGFFYSNGESDIEVYFSTLNNQVWCFLIENKINAKFQPSQAERYKERGQSYLKDNKCIGFNTILIAPVKYLNNCNTRKEFDFYITYQDLHTWFTDCSKINSSETEACRAKYKAKQIQLAIEKY